MTERIEVYKKYWYLIALSIVLAIPAIRFTMISTYIIGSLCENLIIGWLLGTLIATSIATLPLKCMYNKAKKEIQVEKTLYIRLVIIYYVILGSYTFVTGIMHW